MTRKLGERRELARQVRKRLASYLYWLEACGRDEAKARRVLLAARAELGRLVGLDAAAAGIGGEGTDGHLEIERLASPENCEAGGLDYEAGHRVALARELTYAAGCPLRDRYGFAAADEDVLFVVDAVFREPDDARARFLIGSANGDRIELAMACDAITDEAYELAIVRALRPLAEQRRDAAARSL